MTDPRKRVLGKTDMVVDFFTSRTTEAKTKSITDAWQSRIGFRFSNKTKDELGTEKYIIVRFLMTTFHL